jgi:hypothetical protein
VPNRRHIRSLRITKIITHPSSILEPTVVGINAEATFMEV